MLPCSGAPDSVRCTRVDHLKLASFRFSGSHSAIIHQTVRCATGQSGAPAEQRLTHATVDSAKATVRYSARQKSEQKSEAHRTVNRTYPVWHRIVRCAKPGQPSVVFCSFNLNPFLDFLLICVEPLGPVELII